MTLLLKEVYHHGDLTLFMKKTLALFFVLSLFALGCQGVQTPVTTGEQQTTTTSLETEISEVKHYSGRCLSFDYPSDLSIYLDEQGEGALVDTITFVGWDEEGDVYRALGPVVRIQEYSGSEEFEKMRSEAEVQDTFKELDLPGAQAFQVNSGGGFCDAWDIAYFLYPRDEAQALGVFSASMCAGSRYQEILDLFLKTVRFN